MKQKMFCRICLQPATRTDDLDATLDAYYDELMYYDVIQHSDLTVCLYCEHLLRKAYNIRQRCRRAHILLKSWSKDMEKASLDILWKLLPKNPITMVNNQAVQKLFACIDKELETGSDTTKDNVKSLPLIPMHYKQEIKNDIKSYYQEFCGDTELQLKEDDENNTNENHTASDNENAPNNPSDNESDDVFEDNFEDFFKSKAEIKGSKESEPKELKKQKRKEKIVIIKRAKSRAILVKFIDDGLLKDLELDRENMLNWFDQTPMYTLRVKGILNAKRCSSLDKWRDFFSILKKRYTTKYDFDVELLATHEQKVAEFVARQHSEQFITAPSKCFICFKVFPRSGLQEYHHKLYHDESLPMKCEICLCGFQTKKQLHTHKQISHEIVFRCKICQYVTRSRQIIQIHHEEHNNDGIFCKLCGKQFRKVKTMTQHMLCHKRGVCCPFCAGWFDPQGLGIHQRSKHKNDPLFEATPALPCSECDVIFHYENALKIHTQRDHKEYKCSCGEVFADDMSLDTHTKETKHARIKRQKEKKDANTKYVRCNVCATDIEFTSSFALHNHYRAVHPAVSYISYDKRKNVVICEHCGLPCVVGAEYEDHLNTHSGEKPYECSECGARFATRALAEHHLKIHIRTKEKIMKKSIKSAIKHKCEVCAIEVGNAYSLRRHMMIHKNVNGEVVTSRVVMPKLKVSTGKPKKLTKSAFKNKIQVYNKERSTNNYGSKGSECMESESLHNEETSDSFTEQNLAVAGLGMEVIFDFKNEVVEEVVI